MRHHGQHRDPVPRPSEARRPDLHRGTAGDRERREARRGTSEGRAEGRQVRGDLLEVLPAAGPRPGRRPGQAREQRNALRQEGQWDGPRPPHGGLSGPDAGRSVRAERFHLEGAEETRCAARLHPRRLRHGPDGDEAAGLGGRDGPRAREGDGEVRRRVLTGRARSGDRRRERPAVGPRPPVRHECGMPHGRDVRIFRRPEVGAGGARGPHEVPRARDFVQRIGDEGEADRPDYVEAEGHRGRAGDAGQARRPRVYWIGAKSLYARRGLSLATGMGDDEKRKAFLKGFEEGLKAAWREIAALMTRGYSSTELMVFAKSKMAIAEPTALVDIASAISEFASDGGNAAVLLEGLEYLISQNGFPSVMRFLQKVNEKIVINDSYLLISANPAAMKEQEYTVLAKEVAGEV